jgi:hypothetical protein
MRINRNWGAGNRVADNKCLVRETRHRTTVWFNTKQIKDITIVRLFVKLLNTL